MESNLLTDMADAKETYQLQLVSSYSNSPRTSYGSEDYETNIESLEDYAVGESDEATDDDADPFEDIDHSD